MRVNLVTSLLPTLPGTKTNGPRLSTQAGELCTLPSPCQCSLSYVTWTCSYEYLRVLFSDLRGQLLHLTGKDPLVEDHPYFNEPIKNISPIPGKVSLNYRLPIIHFMLCIPASSFGSSLRGRACLWTVTWWVAINWVSSSCRQLLDVLY